MNLKNIANWEEEEKSHEEKGKRKKVRKRTLYFLGVPITATESIEQDENVD